MRIIVNHLTRMQPGYICIAGIDAKTHEHIRPVLPGTRLTTQLLRRNGGPFDIGCLVELGSTQASGSAPELEDHSFDQEQLVFVKDLSADYFWRALSDVSDDSLTAIFGKHLLAQRRGCAVDEGKGRVSLGCLRPSAHVSVSINHWDKIRAQVNDGTFDVDLSITDLRLYEEDQKTPRTKAVINLQRRLQQGIDVILSVGLARAFQVSGDTARRHWLQVNNIHLKDDPVWQVDR